VSEKRKAFYYIHKNPCHPKWDLAAHPNDYFYSSARFYYDRKNDFEILKHYAENMKKVVAGRLTCDFLFNNAVGQSLSRLVGATDSNLSLFKSDQPQHGNSSQHLNIFIW
jgi:hypothetical protein